MKEWFSNSEINDVLVKHYQDSVYSRWKRSVTVLQNQDKIFQVNEK